MPAVTPTRTRNTINPCKALRTLRYISVVVIFAFIILCVLGIFLFFRRRVRKHIYVKALIDSPDAFDTSQYIVDGVTLKHGDIVAHLQTGQFYIYRHSDLNKYIVHQSCFVYVKHGTVHAGITLWFDYADKSFTRRNIDVAISNASENNMIVHEGSGIWTTKSLQISDLSDTRVDSPVESSVLMFQNGTWVGSYVTNENTRDYQSDTMYVVDERKLEDITTVGSYIIKFDNPAYSNVFLPEITETNNGQAVRITSDTQFDVYIRPVYSDTLLSDTKLTLSTNESIVLIARLLNHDWELDDEL